MIAPQATLRVDWTAEHCGVCYLAGVEIGADGSEGYRVFVRAEHYLVCTEIGMDGSEGDRVLVRVIRHVDREVKP